MSARRAGPARRKRWFWNVNRPVPVPNPACQFCWEPPLRYHISSFAGLSMALSIQWLEFQMLIGV